MKLKLTVLVLLMSAASTLAAPNYATLEQFSSAVVGKTISSSDKKGNAFTAVFNAGGKGDFQKAGKKPAHFKWSFSKGTVCWDFGDFKECNKVEIVSPTAVKFYDAKSGALNNDYVVK